MSLAREVIPSIRATDTGAQPSSPSRSPSSDCRRWRLLPHQRAISAPDAREEAGARAVLRRAEIHGNRLAGFENGLRPARADQLAGRTALDLPLHLAAVSVVDRQEDP